MSPARSKRQPVPHKHSRDDIVKAVAVGAGITLATALLVWLMRPGPAGIPATGGIMNRQPRASWLVGTALGVAGIAIYVILRGRRATRARAKVLIPVSLGVVLIASVVVGFVWPGGLLRHDVAPPPAPKPAKTKATTTTTTLLPTGSGATGSGATGSGAAGSGLEGGTSVLGSTGPESTTPTTGTPTTQTPPTQSPTTASK